MNIGLIKITIQVSIPKLLRYTKLIINHIINLATFKVTIILLAIDRFVTILHLVVCTGRYRLSRRLLFIKAVLFYRFGALFRATIEAIPIIRIVLAGKLPIVVQLNDLLLLFLLLFLLLQLSVFLSPVNISLRINDIRDHLIRRLRRHLMNIEARRLKQHLIQQKHQEETGDYQDLDEWETLRDVGRIFYLE